MTGAELKAIRQALRLTLSGFGTALGYRGNKNTRSVQIRRLESGARPIPPWIAISALRLSGEVFVKKDSNKGVA
jgi:transcriptional regulator with XRE-family HTH domain